MNQFSPVVIDVDDPAIRSRLYYESRAKLDPDAKGSGIIPRDHDGKWTRGNDRCLATNIFPVEDKISDIIKEDDMEEVIELCHANKTFPTYHIDKLGHMDEWTQNGLNYCWAWGVGGCFMACQGVEYGWDKVNEVAPVSLGWTVNWRNAGNYLGDAMEAISTKGIAPLSYVDSQHSRNPRNYKDGWETAAHANTVKEWWDIDCSDSMGTVLEMLTILATGRPLYIAHNWWSHALMIVGLVWDKTKPFNVRVQHYNSHGDGLIELTGNRAIPDEAYGIRSVSPPMELN